MEYNESDLIEIRRNEDIINNLRKTKKIVKSIVSILFASIVIGYFLMANNNPGNDAYGYVFLLFGPIVLFVFVLIYFLVNNTFEIIMNKYENNISRVRYKYCSNEIKYGIDKINSKINILNVLEIVLSVIIVICCIVLIIIIEPKDGFLIFSIVFCGLLLFGIINSIVKYLKGKYKFKIYYLENSSFNQNMHM